MIPDAVITDQRARVFRELPWPIPACVLLEMRDEDLDNLAAASDVGDRDGYWRILNRVVTRFEAKGGEL